MTLLCLIILTSGEVAAQSTNDASVATTVATDTTLADSIPTNYVSLSVLPVDYDSLLAAAVWQELDGGPRQGYYLRLDQYGTFEEDAGEGTRRYRYLKGRWEIDTSSLILTLSVDRFLAEGLVHRRYRGKDGDFYIPFRVLYLTEDHLVLEETETGDVRHFSARDPADFTDPAQRNVPKVSPVRFKLPKGW